MFDVKEDVDLFELDERDFDTVLASDIAFNGEIHFTKPFIVKGAVTGKIDSTGDLVIDSSAVINADITASRVLIRGKVNGNIQGERLVFVTQTGFVKGDISSQQLVLEPGSSFSGLCTTIPSDKK